MTFVPFGQIFCVGTKCLQWLAPCCQRTQLAYLYYYYSSSKSMSTNGSFDSAIFLSQFGIHLSHHKEHVLFFFLVCASSPSFSSSQRSHDHFVVCLTISRHFSRLCALDAAWFTVKLVDAFIACWLVTYPWYLLPAPGLLVAPGCPHLCSFDNWRI